MTGLCVGVDLGGTKIETAVFAPAAHARTPRELNLSETPRTLHRERVPTLQEEGYEAIIERVAAAVRQACAQVGLDPRSASLGVGMPGGVERRSGRVKNSNTTCLNGQPFRSDLERRLARTSAISFDNDANCFALAEATAGAARAHADGLVFGVIMGTGVGGGLVLGGRVWSGLHGIAGEWGHHAIPSRAPARACYCGQSGCVEPLLSGPGLEQRYRALTQGARAPLRVADIARAAASGVDAAASTVIEELLDGFGRALANVIDVLDPSAVVLGGGLSNLDILYDRGRDRVARYVFNDELLTPILKHELGDSAGVLGAALLPAAQNHRSSWPATPSPL